MTTSRHKHGEIPVTRDDIERWLEINTPNVRKIYKEKYIKQWNVVKNIKKSQKGWDFSEAYIGKSKIL